MGKEISGHRRILDSRATENIGLHLFGLGGSFLPRWLTTNLSSWKRVGNDAPPPLNTWISHDQWS